MITEHSATTQTKWSPEDEGFMAEAVRLAKLGSGWVNPNPQVGCVIVKDGRIIGSGYHQRFGQPHAERNALADALAHSEDVTGSTVYVTLEPCAHQGKTPPCVDALVEAKPARVVVGMVDPHDKVAGRGIHRLRDAGIDVDVGCLEEGCRELNRPFVHFITTGMPLVVAKYAMTLDGKIATRTGASQWITGEKARHRVHELRSRYAAIMVGVGTVLADDPSLTARIDGVQPEDIHQPWRIICDGSLRTPLDSQLIRTAREFPTLIATVVSDPDQWAPYEEAGVRVVALPGNRSESSSESSSESLSAARSVDLPALLRLLGDEGIDSILVEGGPTLLGTLFDEGLVNEVHAFIAPKIFGGEAAPSPVGGMGVKAPSDGHQLTEVRTETLGEDLLVSGILLKDR